MSVDTLVNKCEEANIGGPEKRKIRLKVRPDFSGWVRAGDGVAVSSEMHLDL
ncbi:hypothetical protein [Mycolicibacterium septicum]|uniref:hypothetical protein n=1 Tax=Mycolicibacterium septicum TaxID=98668 RepID=UPI00236008B9|nr:hypothetical protein [Mycolicibacterium septicum]